MGRVLLAGAPGLRSGKSTVGGVHIYALSADTSTSTINATLTATIVGEDPLAEFGHAIAAQPAHDNVEGVVAISSPAAGNVSGGEVRLLSSQVLVNLSQEAGSDVPVSKLPLKARLVAGGGSASFGRFGWRLAFADIAGDAVPDLIAAAPLENGGLLRRETGRVYVWDGVALPSGEVTNLQKAASWTVAGQHPRGRLGSAFAFAGTTDRNHVLAVGSPRADVDKLEMAGAVDFFNVSCRRTAGGDAGVGHALLI